MVRIFFSFRLPLPLLSLSLLALVNRPRQQARSLLALLLTIVMVVKSFGLMIKTIHMVQLRAGPADWRTMALTTIVCCQS
jgi:hypothetical protein